MTPRLIAISGKMKGTVFALCEKEVNVGREATNAVCLNESSVSRHHCVIKQHHNGCFFIHDLESFNGVFVNGTPVNEKEIKHGDQLGIGDVIMFFLLHETESETAFRKEQQLELVDDEPDNRPTVKLTRKDCTYLFPENLLAELPQMMRVGKNLSVLLQAASMINSVRESDSLHKKLLELVMKIIPAERGAILLVEETEIVSHFVLDSTGYEGPRKLRISQTVIEACLKEQVSILCNDVCRNEKFQLAESLIASKIHSILCTPMILFDKVLGLVYLDTSDASAFFDQDHLQLLTGISEIAAGPLENAIYIQNLKEENLRLLGHLDNSYKIIGESSKIQEVSRLIAKIAPTESTVLILGESGTGKELAARSIHQNSERKSGPFVAINCATLTESLLESELFGHERGAFTGAIVTKKGQFELADGGTIFLDEIAELALALQAKLLRALQEREIMRVGGAKAKNIDIRVLTATNRDLNEAVKSGRFREDLYYRLNVISLKMPPLRERPEDIPLLTRFFLNKYNHKCKRTIKGLSSDAKACLQKYKWDGNVRELENVIERAVILSAEDIITPMDLPEAILEGMSEANVIGNDEDRKLTYHDAVLDAKKNIIKNAITKMNGNITEAAKSLGIHPNNLHRLLKTFDIRK